MNVDKLFDTNPFSYSKGDRDLFVAGVRETANIHYHEN